MPVETELILHLKIADLWNAPLLKGLLTGPQAQEQVQKMQLATGLAPTDIDLNAFPVDVRTQIAPFTSLGVYDANLVPKPALAVWDSLFRLRTRP